MLDERKRIRHALKSAVEIACEAAVYTNRQPDVRHESRYVTLFFDQGEINYEGISTIVETQLSVGYHQSGLVDDDTLDDNMYVIDNALHAAERSQYIIGISPLGFEYLAVADDQFSSLINRYIIYYQRK